jgi:hypothetical protein
MNQSEKIDDNLQELARFAKAIAHPSRLAIMLCIPETRSCICGDILLNSLNPYIITFNF